MKHPARPLAVTALLLASPAAIAADPPGLLTLVVGVPLLAVASFVLTLLLILRPGTLRRRIAGVLFIPTLLYSLYVALDAATLFQDLGSENSMIGVAFFTLLALSCALFRAAIQRPASATGAP